MLLGNSESCIGNSEACIGEAVLAGENRNSATPGGCPPSVNWGLLTVLVFRL
jgi:hypothetical protein